MWEVWLWAALCSGLVLSAPHLGESTELAWLLVHESPQQSPLLLRRITPKSVFLAPTFTSCSEGYRQDSMGRCVKVVKLNQQAQWEFYLQKLNSMYAAPEPSKKENTGPLKLPIPIEEEPTEEPTTTTTTEPTTIVTTEQQQTETPFLIVVANTTDQVEIAESTTTEGTTTQVTEESVPSSTTKTTTDMSVSTTMTTTTGGSTIIETSTLTTTKCEDCVEAEAEESVVTESFSPIRSTVRFPDTRKRPSSYVRFPDSYPTIVPPPYWWPHSWGRPQAWQPQTYSGRPSSYHRERPHWSSTAY